MRYGFLVDPVGKPVERGYAVLHQAMKAGAGLQFAQSFLQGVWADGMDAGTDTGLYAIAARAGLDKAFSEAWENLANRFVVGDGSDFNSTGTTCYRAATYRVIGQACVKVCRCDTANGYNSDGATCRRPEKWSTGCSSYVCCT
jgi:hypothetical protein